jgi:hypothetical protein
MKIIPLSDLHLRARQRPAGYIEAVLSEAAEVTASHYTLTDEAYARLKKRFRADLTCSHRGEQVDEVQCLTCRGRVMAKVFACAVHGRCTMFAKPIDRIKACRSCADRKPITAPQTRSRTADPSACDPADRQS